MTTEPTTTETNAAAPAIETSGLERRFGDLVAVDGVDLRVPRGSFYGFLGANGAGKSTTIHCLTGLLTPTRGRMRILGLDPEREPVAVKRRVGVMPEELALFDRLTGAETLTFVGRVHGLDPGEIESRRRELLEVMALADDADALAGDYSHGMRKKLALAAALLPGPELLFLDEPFEGIDAVASRQIKGLLGSFVAGGGTVFLTSHILEVVERLCDHIGVIHRGRLVAQGPIAELRAGGVGGDGAGVEAGAEGEGRSLEELFFELVGADGAAAAEISWLGGRAPR